MVPNGGKVERSPSHPYHLNKYNLVCGEGFYLLLHLSFYLGSILLANSAPTVIIIRPSPVQS